MWPAQCRMPLAAMADGLTDTGIRIRSGRRVGNATFTTLMPTALLFHPAINSFAQEDRNWEVVMVRTEIMTEITGGR